jgi:hypothetical protein
VPRATASWSSCSASFDREVLSTVPPNLLIASTALCGITFSSIRNSAEVPGLTRSCTWSWKAMSTPVLMSLPTGRPAAPTAIPETGMKNNSRHGSLHDVPQVAPVPTE